MSLWMETGTYVGDFCFCGVASVIHITTVSTARPNLRYQALVLPDQEASNFSTRFVPVSLSLLPLVPAFQ